MLIASAAFVTSSFAQDALIDTDNDGLSGEAELALGTDPSLPDTDGDGIDDATEAFNGTDPLIQGAEVALYVRDTDGDGLSDSVEKYQSLTNPDLPDTDGDGMSDGYEREAGFDPLVSDLADNESLGEDLVEYDEELLDGSELDKESEDGDDDPYDVECP